MIENAMNELKQQNKEKLLPRWLAPSRRYAKTFQALKLDYFNDSSFFNVHKQFQGKARSLYFNLCHVHITRGRESKNFKIKFIICFPPYSVTHSLSHSHLLFSINFPQLAIVVYSLAVAFYFSQLPPKTIERANAIFIALLSPFSIWTVSENHRGVQKVLNAIFILYWTFNKCSYYSQQHTTLFSLR